MRLLPCKSKSMGTDCPNMLDSVHMFNSQLSKDIMEESRNRNLFNVAILERGTKKSSISSTPANPFFFFGVMTKALGLGVG